ncbi:hypothetical protein ABZT26_36140 [Streptomyces sp. NPDC005395]|uniref:hypothetical protein n=1 Tax=Streptomyces sp. NPDC005395 TaxID=3157042 RepID=UPI00339F07C9
MSARKPITPTELSAEELADFLAQQANERLRPLFFATNTDTLTGSRVVYDGTMEVVRALRAGEIAPVVAQVRMLGVNRRARHYLVSTMSCHRSA